jgi:hypothetical protein
MTIKIFNDDPDHFIYPVLTTGRGDKDIWMQAWFSVKTSEIGNKPYPRNNNYRLYINPAHGIAPHTGITLTLPLFTQLEAQIKPKPGSDPDTFIDWWNGGTIQLYTSPGTVQAPAKQPLSLTDALARPESDQKPVAVNFANAVKPTCDTCEPLTIYSDVADLPKEDGSQLLEYTLGARNLPSLKNRDAGIAEALDTSNVDFDVSYVNVVWAPAAMGVYKNKQVGYVGTDQTIDAFQAPLNKFKDAAASKGWPQFVKTYTNIKPTPPATTNLKFPSPLEIFAVLTGANAPTNLTRVPAWPTQLWAPIEDLQKNWISAAGTVTADTHWPYYKNQDGTCGKMLDPGAPVQKWCDAIVAVKALLLRNYSNYRKIYSSKCKGTPVDITDKLLIAHVYGWGPWIESATGVAGDGCPADANLLQNTPDQNGDPLYFKMVTVDGQPVKDYTKYLTVKLGFDNLNKGDLPEQKYTLNPWVDLIHNQLKITCGYAYSVDDALGNVQAEGQGFIVDVGSTEHLENRHECSPPINISLGYDPNAQTRFTQYAVCDQNDVKPVNSAFPSFIINSNDPAGCPIYLWDNGAKVDSNGNPIPGTPQLYTFTVGVTPDKFPLYDKYPDPPAPKWTAANADPPGSTAAPIVCTGNTSSSPFQQSSTVWCCDAASSSGVFAYAAPEALSAHQSKIYTVTTQPAEKCAMRDGNQPVASGCRVIVKACSQGK